VTSQELLLCHHRLRCGEKRQMTDLCLNPSYPPHQHHMECATSPGVCIIYKKLHTKQDIALGFLSPSVYAAQSTVI
jgi:hypothetical protein